MHIAADGNAADGHIAVDHVPFGLSAGAPTGVAARNRCNIVLRLRFALCVQIGHIIHRQRRRGQQAHEQAGGQQDAQQSSFHLCSLLWDRVRVVLPHK